MGNTSDGSSSAAQSAQIDPTPPQPRSLWARLLGRISSHDDPLEEVETPASPDKIIRPGMLNLRRMRVEDVAIPKPDIVSAPITATKEELVEIFRESGLTRMPIFEGTLDSPIGFANLKDFALRFGFNGDEQEFDLRGLLRPLLYVPPSMGLGVLLQKMQSERIHMALVIDEYGGTDGLVTIEDLIEQVVGAIEDEHDVEEEKSFTKEAPGVYLALARTALDEFEGETGIDLTAHAEIDDEDVETLGGLVFMLSGAVPARGEILRHPDGPEFEVLDADPRRIKRLRVRLPQFAG